MNTHSNRRLGITLVLGVSLAVVASLPSSAAPSAPKPLVSARGAGTQSPDPNAPHVGSVAGIRRGPGMVLHDRRVTRTFRELHRQLGAKSETPDGLIHVYVGTSFDDLPTLRGTQATQSVAPIKVTTPDTPLYTPTMYPNGDSCVEVATTYFNNRRIVGAWDWCHAINFAAEVNINRRFLQSYTQNQNYSTQIVKTNPTTNEWTAYIYNYTTATWQTLYVQSGTGQTGLQVGWDLYELYSGLKPNGQSYACDDLFGKRNESQDIQMLLGSNWVLADPTNAGDDYDVPLSEFHCDSLQYQMITDFSHWKAMG